MGLELSAPSGASAASGFVGPPTAPPSGRGFVVQLAQVGLNLNSVSLQTILNIPVSGVGAGAHIDSIELWNFSGAPTTNTVSFGSSPGGTDVIGATALPAGAGPGKTVRIFPGSNAPAAIIAPSGTLSANVSVGGAAITCNCTVWGYYA